MTLPEAARRDAKASIRTLLSRLGQLLAIVLLVAAVAMYFRLRFTGWAHPLAKMFGLYRYNVATLAEYVEYKRDANSFYSEQHAAVLSFDCDRIRDDFVRVTHGRMVSDAAESFGGPGKVVDLVARFHLLGAWREGAVLHLANPNVADTGPKAVFGATFAMWRDQVTELATLQHPREEAHYGSLLQALFTEVVVHGAGESEKSTITTRRRSKFDACGPPRE